MVNPDIYPGEYSTPFKHDMKDFRSPSNRDEDITEETERDHDVC